MGLAWTPMGGATPYVETVTDAFETDFIKQLKDDETKLEQTSNSSSNSSSVELESKLKKKKRKRGAAAPGLQFVGKPGEVLKETTEIAYTFARKFLDSKSNSKNKFFESASLHMYIPDGSLLKERASAGCAMVTSLLSLARGQAVDEDLAMTGEVTLLGKILPVEGIKEKVIAAKRAGVKTVVLPKDNRAQWEELQPNLKIGLVVKFVDHYNDLYQIVFDQKSDIQNQNHNHNHNIKEERKNQKGKRIKNVK